MSVLPRLRVNEILLHMHILLLVNNALLVLIGKQSLIFIITLNETEKNCNFFYPLHLKWEKVRKLKSERENNIANCLLDPRGILSTMYINGEDKEQRKMAGIRSKYDQIIPIHH